MKSFLRSVFLEHSGKFPESVLFFWYPAAINRVSNFSSSFKANSCVTSQPPPNVGCHASEDAGSFCVARSHFEALGVIVPVEGCVTPPLESDSEQAIKTARDMQKTMRVFFIIRLLAF